MRFTRTNINRGTSRQVRVTSLCIKAAAIGAGVLIVAFVAGGSAPAAVAAESDDPSHTAALTAFGLGTRPLGMGGAFVAMADDASALYYNPAGLAAVGGREVVSQYESRFGVLNTLAVGYVQDGWGAAYLGYNLGVIERRDEFANRVGDSFAVGEQILIGSYARNVNSLIGGLDAVGRIDLGASLKYYSQTLADESGSGITADLGALWRPGAAPYRLGLVVRNAVGQVSYTNETSDPFDPTIVVGASYERGPWLAALDKELPGYFRVGGEYAASDMITLRAGAFGDEQWTFTAGLGVTIDRYEVQYAYEQPSVLDGTHRLSFGMRF